MPLCEDYKRTAGNGAQKKNNLKTDRLEGIKTIQSSTVGFNTLEHLCRTDNDFMGALFMQLPDGYKTDFPEEVIELGTDKLVVLHCVGIIDF